MSVTVVATAHADGDASDKLASDARALADSGNFAGAAAKFREAYAADPKPELMCNVGVAFYKAKDFPHAARYLDQCVATGATLDANFISTVRTVADAVDQKLRADNFTPIDLVVEPATAGTIVEYNAHADEPLLGSHRAWVPFGHYKLTIHAEGFADKVIEGTATSHDAIAARAKLDAAAVVRPPDLKPDKVYVDRPVVVHDRSYTAPILATTIAGTSGIVALSLYIYARKRANDAGNEILMNEYLRLVSSSHNWQHASWVVGGVAGVAAVASGYLWWHARHGTTVAIEPSANGGAVSLSGTF